MEQARQNRRNRKGNGLHDPSRIHDNLREEASQALIDLVASRSYCITSPTEVRTRTLDQVRELLATHPALANSTGLAMPYVTVCIRATLAG